MAALGRAPKLGSNMAAARHPTHHPTHPNPTALSLGSSQSPEAELVPGNRRHLVRSGNQVKATRARKNGADAMALHKRSTF